MGDWVVYVMVAFGCACIVLYMWIAWLDWWPGYKEARHLQKVRKQAEEERYEQGRR